MERPYLPCDIQYIYKWQLLLAMAHRLPTECKPCSYIPRTAPSGPYWRTRYLARNSSGQMKLLVLQAPRCFAIGLCFSKRPSAANHQVDFVASHPSGSFANHCSDFCASHPSDLCANHPSGSFANHPSGYFASYPSDSFANHPSGYFASYPSDSFANHPSGYFASYPSDFSASHPSGYFASYPSDFSASHPSGYFASYPSDSFANHLSHSFATGSVRSRCLSHLRSLSATWTRLIGSNSCFPTSDLSSCSNSASVPNSADLLPFPLPFLLSSSLPCEGSRGFAAIFVPPPQT